MAAIVGADVVRIDVRIDADDVADMAYSSNSSYSTNN
jgi:hypothetical protein